MGCSHLLADDSAATTEALDEHRRQLGVEALVVVSGEGAYFGDALNIAALAQSIARPGGISISGNVYRDLDEPALRFRPMGRQDLKNIPARIGVCEFADLPAPRPTLSGRGSLGLGSPGIAVLPAHTDTVDPSLASMADRIRADLVHQLAQIPNLDVIAQRGLLSPLEHSDR